MKAWHMPTRMPLHAPCSRSLLFVTTGVAIAVGARYVYDNYYNSTRDCDVESTSTTTTPPTAAVAANGQAPVPPVRRQISFQLVDEMVSIDHDAEPSSELLAVEPVVSEVEAAVSEWETKHAQWEAVWEAERRSWKVQRRSLKAKLAKLQEEKETLLTQVQSATTAADHAKSEAKNIKTEAKKTTTRLIAKNQEHRQLQLEMRHQKAALAASTAHAADVQQQLDDAQESEAAMRAQLTELRRQIQVYRSERETQAPAAAQQQQPDEDEDAADRAAPPPPQPQAPSRPRAVSTESREPETQVERQRPRPPAVVAPVQRKRLPDPTRPTKASVLRQLEIKKQMKDQQKKVDADRANDVPPRVNNPTRERTRELRFRF